MTVLHDDGLGIEKWQSWKEEPETTTLRHMPKYYTIGTENGCRRVLAGPSLLERMWDHASAVDIQIRVSLRLPALLS